MSINTASVRKRDNSSHDSALAIIEALPRSTLDEVSPSIMMLKNILCAVDGSDHSDKATEVAAGLAHVHSAELHVAHVLMRDLTFAGLGNFAEHPHLKDIIATEQQALTKLMTSGKVAFVPGACEAVVQQLATIILFDAERLAAKQGIETVKTVLLDGSPADELTRYVEQLQPEMVVVGTRGLGRIKGALLGSVSQKLMSHTAGTCVCVK